MGRCTFRKGVHERRKILAEHRTYLRVVLALSACLHIVAKRAGHIADRAAQFANSILRGLDEGRGVSSTSLSAG